MAASQNPAERTGLPAVVVNVTVTDRQGGLIECAPEQRFPGAKVSEVMDGVAGAFVGPKGRQLVSYRVPTVDLRGERAVRDMTMDDMSQPAGAFFGANNEVTVVVDPGPDDGGSKTRICLELLPGNLSTPEQLQAVGVYLAAAAVLLLFWKAYGPVRGRPWGGALLVMVAGLGTAAAGMFVARKTAPGLRGRARDMVISGAGVFAAGVLIQVVKAFMWPRMWSRSVVETA